MGAVWLGTDEVLGREVALKQLTPVHDGGAPQVRAQREAQLAARLSHPHVVAVFDLVTEGDQPWLVMEYVDGTTLSGLVAEHGPLPPERAARLLAPIADALRAAHAAGVMHRDVKPSNILVARDGRVKLTDFGIARGVSGDLTLTRTGMVTGSPSYLSPELASGASATGATDVWSLGATLFFALTGRAPYEVGDNVLSTLYRIVHEEPPRTDRAGRLAPVLAGMMTRDPAARWSVEEVYAALSGRPAPAAAPARRPAATAPDEPTRAMTAPMPPPPPPLTRQQPASAAPPAEPPRDGDEPVLLAYEPTPHRDRPRRRGGRTAALVGAVVLALVLLLGFWLIRPGDDPEPVAQESTAGQSPSPTRSASPSPSPTASPEPTDEGVRSFVDTYLHTAVSDPAAAYDMLTPAFQQASGGLEGYRGWWGQVRRIDRIESVQVQLGDQLGVGYRYTYTMRNGETHTEEVRLRLTFVDGRYLIAGD